jgi:RNA polymerase sigma-70 factor (ECF subfamily)
VLSAGEQALVDRLEQRKSGVVTACGELVQHGRDGDDTVQEACVRALQVQAPEKVIDPVRYVLRIARNFRIDRRRKSRREEQLFEPSVDSALFADDRPAPERALSDKKSLAGVLAAIDRLPPRCRQAFLLHRFENLSYTAVAHCMGISISAVEKHIAEAMVRLSRARDEMS